MSQIEQHEVFISSRYTILAKPPRRALIAELRKRGIPVWDGDVQFDVVLEVSQKIDLAPLSVVLATADYAEYTGVDGNTYTEIQLLKQKYNKNKKAPFLYIKMCNEFKFPIANAVLPPSLIYAYLWLPNAAGDFGSPPKELVDLIVQKYMDITSTANVTNSSQASGQVSTSPLPTNSSESHHYLQLSEIYLEMLDSKPFDDELKGKLPDLFESFRSDIMLHLKEFKAGSRKWLFQVISFTQS